MIQHTIREQKRALAWHRRRQVRPTPRRLLRETDELMFCLEECLVQELRLVPGWLMPRLVALLASTDPSLPRELGSERRPEQLVEFLYRAQEALMERSIADGGPATIIPLFR